MSENSLVATIEKVALNPEVDVMKMEKLLDMQERVIDKNAEVAYSRAMSVCQGDMPTVVRDATNKQTNSSYAKFESILSICKPIYTKHGFALTFGTDDSPIENHIRITCDIMHSEGHSKVKYVDLPLDISGIKGNANKTKMHATGSTYSYGERYLCCMVFNITIADQDNDGNRPGDITVEKLLNYNKAVRDLFPSIAAVKLGLAEGDYSAAFEAWCELNEEEQRSIWKAPSKGGIFTTKEVSEFKSSEWSQARQEFSSKPTEEK